MRRRTWGNKQPITFSDLNDIGTFTWEALQRLANGFGTGILSGLEVLATTPTSQQVTVKTGHALFRDDTARLTYLAFLDGDSTVDFSGQAAGTYYLIASPSTSAVLESRTIAPPPATLPNGNSNPFYQSGMSSYTQDTVIGSVITLSVSQSAPTGTAFALATVNFSGGVITQQNITKVQGSPTPLMADGGITPVKIHSSIAGAGISRNSTTGVLAVNVDGSTLENSGSTLQIKASGVTDSRIGSRTIDDTRAPSDNAGTLGELLSELANRIRVIGTGTDWKGNVTTTLNALDSAAAKRNSATTISAVWNFAAKPTASSTVDGDTGSTLTTKDWVSAKISAIQLPGGNLTDGSVTTVKLADGGVVTAKLADGSVTDGKIGSRTLDQSVTLPASASAANTNTYTTLLNWMLSSIRQIKGTTNWFDAVTSLSALNTTVSTLNTRSLNPIGSLGGGGAAYVTDTFIGNRTVSGTTGGDRTALLGDQLNRMAQVLQSITGSANWYDASAVTLSSISSGYARKGQAETISGVWDFSTYPTLPSGSAPTGNQPARMSDLSAVSGSQNSHRTNAVLDHPDGSVTTAKIQNAGITAAKLASDARVYDMAAFYPAKLFPDVNVFATVAVRPLTIVSSDPGRLTALSAATGTPLLTIKKNGNAVGTIQVSGTTGTFSIGADITLAAGDVLTVQGPASPDSTLGDIAITFKGRF